MRHFVIAAGVFLLLVCALPASGAARHHHRRYPAVWLKDAHCIHYQEVRAPWPKGWHRTTTWLGAPSRNRGGMQILDSTWAAYAPKGWPRDPARASRAQQLLVTWRIWRANGQRWGGGQWPQSAAACGVR